MPTHWSAETWAAIGAAVVAVIGAIASAVVLVWKQRSQDRRDDFALVVDQLQKHVAAQDKRIDNLEEDKDTCRKDNKRLQEQVESLERENEALRGKVATLEAKVRELEAK